MAFHRQHVYTACFGRLLKYNIYMQFKDATDFTAYRMRSGQTGFFDFK
jgi:hypothetical protein